MPKCNAKPKFVANLYNPTSTCSSPWHNLSQNFEHFAITRRACATTFQEGGSPSGEDGWRNNGTDLLQWRSPGRHSALASRWRSPGGHQTFASFCSVPLLHLTLPLLVAGPSESFGKLRYQFVCSDAAWATNQFPGLRPMRPTSAER
jgi:hypothetical protein